MFRFVIRNYNHPLKTLTNTIITIKTAETTKRQQRHQDTKTAMIKETIPIINKLGLHARAAAKLVSTATRYASDVKISRNGKEVDGKSIMSVMMLAASCGTDVDLIIDGSDENEAFTAVKELIADRFGEDE